MVVKSSFHVYRRRNFWGNRNLRRKNFQYIFRVWERRFQSFAKVFGRTLRAASYLSSGSFQRKIFREMRCICVAFPDLEPDVSDFLRRVLFWKYQKIFSLAQNYVLVVTSVWKLGFIFQSYCKKDSGPLWKPLGSIVKTICLVSTRSYWRTMFFEIFINFFLSGLSALTFWMFGELVLVGLSKLLFMGLEDTFGGKKFEWKLHNLEHKRRFLAETSVWNLRFTSTHSRRWKMRLFCEDLFGRVVKTESFVSRRYYRRKTFFKIFIIFFFFGLSAKTSRTLGRNFFGWKKSLQYLNLS